jgi:hypothetical protein
MDIHLCNRIYCYTFLQGHTLGYAFTDADFGYLKLNELFSATRCGCNQYRKLSQLHEGQFRVIENIMKDVLSRLSSLNLI